jgi:hypothetical protein
MFAEYCVLILTKFKTAPPTLPAWVVVQFEFVRRLVWALSEVLAIFAV